MSSQPNNLDYENINSTNYFHYKILITERAILFCIMLTFLEPSKVIENIFT